MTTITENVSLAKKIGNFISNILLGETKEIIVRIDERVSGLRSDVDGLKVGVVNLTTALNTHGLDIRVLQVHTKFWINNSPTIPNGLGQKVFGRVKIQCAVPRTENKSFCSHGCNELENHV